MTPTSPPSRASLEERFGRAVAARLAAGSEALPYEIAERLRASRAQAMAQRKPSQAANTSVVAGATPGGALLLGGLGGWWMRLASALPLIALVAGLATIGVLQDEDSAAELADVDAALLTDDLPPAAFTDPGFAQFLKGGTEAH